MKVTILIITLTMLVNISISKITSGRKLLTEQKTSKGLNHFHTFIKNGKRVTITISKHGENPLKALWYKTINKQGEKPEIYTRSHPSKAWTMIPPKTETPETSAATASNMASECTEGWEIGKVVARTITYLAMNQDSLKQLLGGVTLRGESKKKLGERTVDMDKVTIQIKKVVQETARCIKRSFSLMDKSIKESCIHKAIVKEAKILIEMIKSKAGQHGFKCSYSALVKGECQPDTPKKKMRHVY